MDKPTTNHYDMLPPERARKNRPFPDKENERRQRGGLNYKKMNFLDKTLMYLLVKSLKAKKPDELNDDAKGMIATYGKVVDFTDRNAIAPIVREILDSKSNI